MDSNKKPRLPSAGNPIIHNIQNIDQYAASQGYSTAQAISFLADALADKNRRIRKAANSALWSFHHKKKEITGIPELEQLLGDSRSAVRSAVVGALVSSYLGTGDYAKLGQLLKHEDKQIRESAILDMRDMEERQILVPLIPALAAALEDAHIRIHTATLLWHMAAAGHDITPAVPALSKLLIQHEFFATHALAHHCVNKNDSTRLEQLLNSDYDVAMSITSNIVHIYVDKKDLKKIGEMLMHKNETVRDVTAFMLRRTSSSRELDLTPLLPTMAAVLAYQGKSRAHLAATLDHMIYHGVNIAVAVPVLSKTLAEKSYSAVEPLCSAAKNGQDIAGALPSLYAALELRSNRALQRRAASAITYHQLNKKDFAAIEKLLGHEHKFVRYGAITTIYDLAKDERDITVLIPIRVKLLDSPHDELKRFTGWALRAAAKGKQDISAALPALLQASSSDYIPLRKSATGALIHYYLNKNDRSKFQELRYCDNDLMRQTTAQVIKSHEFRNLIGQGGEFLTGETVKPPKKQPAVEGQIKNPKGTVKNS